MTTTIYTIEDIKRMIEEVLVNTDVDKAILFGSYAKNKPTEQSDIDILKEIERTGIVIYEK